MERELWSELSAAISQVASRFPRHGGDVHSTALIARVYLWAVLHQAAMCWACDRRHWDARTRPPMLPHPSTLSRRTRRQDFQQFLDRLGHYLAGRPQSLQWIKRLDGKPLPIPAHSTDRDAGFGRGPGERSKGYKLHALWAQRPMPEGFRVAPLHIGEQEMARRLLRDLRDGGGYVVADKNFDSNALFDAAAARNHQLLARRRYGPHRGLGHHRHSPYRLRSKDMLEKPTAQLTGFGPALLRHRRQIERDFGNCASFTGGLLALPPWVRRIWRVRLWVHAKLLINAARIRRLRRRQRLANA
jgi:hypothetical protein